MSADGGASHPATMAGAAAARIAQYESEVRRAAVELITVNTEAEGWKVIDDMEGVKILQKETGAEKSMFLGRGVVAASPLLLMELCSDTQKKAAYDAVFERATVVEDITSHIKVEHQVYWAPWPVASRDFCMLLTKARLADGTILLFGKSTTHVQVPEQAKYVRATVDLGGWMIRPCDADGKLIEGEHAYEEATHSLVSFFGSTDLRGSLPNLVKAQLDRKQPGLVQAIKPLLVKRQVELAALAKSAPEKYAATMQALKAAVREVPVFTAEELFLAARPQPPRRR